MCWVCNPFCGKCQPAPKKAVKCLACGETTIFDRWDCVDGQTHVCRTCGADVTDLVHVKPVKCKNSGLWCAYPCGKHTRGPKEGYNICKKNTPPRLKMLAILEAQELATVRQEDGDEGNGLDTPP